MDTDGNGAISKEELIAFWKKWYMEKGPGANVLKAPLVLKRQPTQGAGLSYKSTKDLKRGSKEIDKSSIELSKSK